MWEREACCKRPYNLAAMVTAQDLLTRVEEAVDKFLYWDEEVSIMEAVTSVSFACTLFREHRSLPLRTSSSSSVGTSSPDHS